ncbi:hypothetical protein BKA81DRAFT_394938 [Phyllosticta paracitricarpa]|uniref:Uncharacterized protein n=1 Tax=Phyllosticta citricarpa TaxID=55181 RepID=A0ABR1MQL5_9PEZI
MYSTNRPTDQPPHYIVSQHIPAQRSAAQRIASPRAPSIRQFLDYLPTLLTLPSLPRSLLSGLSWFWIACLPAYLPTYLPGSAAAAVCALSCHSVAVHACVRACVHGVAGSLADWLDGLRRQMGRQGEEVGGYWVLARTWMRE